MLTHSRKREEPGYKTRAPGVEMRLPLGSMIRIRLLVSTFIIDVKIWSPQGVVGCVCCLAGRLSVASRYVGMIDCDERLSYEDPPSEETPKIRKNGPTRSRWREKTGDVAARQFVGARSLVAARLRCGML